MKEINHTKLKLYLFKGKRVYAKNKDSILRDNGLVNNDKNLQLIIKVNKETKI
jgi:hypothetical protein